MIAFTVIGLLFFWMCCWHIGYFAAMYFDATAKWDAFMEPYVTELEVVIKHLSDIEASKRAEGA